MRRRGIAFIDVRDLDELGDDLSEWKSGAVLKHIAADRVERAVAEGKKTPVAHCEKPRGQGNTNLFERVALRSEEGRSDFDAAKGLHVQRADRAIAR